MKLVGNNKLADFETQTKIEIESFSSTERSLTL